MQHGAEPPKALSPRFMVKMTYPHRFSYAFRTSIIQYYNDDREYDGLYFSKEVWKLNFRQYGQMEMAQPGRSSGMEKVRREKTRDGEDQRDRKSEERRCRCAKK